MTQIGFATILEKDVEVLYFYFLDTSKMPRLVVYRVKACDVDRFLEKYK